MLHTLVWCSKMVHAKRLFRWIIHSSFRFISQSQHYKSVAPIFPLKLTDSVLVFSYINPNGDANWCRRKRITASNSIGCFWLWKWFIKYSLFLLFEAFNHWKRSDELEKWRNVIKFHWKWGFSQFFLLFYFPWFTKSLFFKLFQKDFTLSIRFLLVIILLAFKSNKISHSKFQFQKSVCISREREIALISRTQNE